MRAILTKILPATETRPKRVKATLANSKHSITLSYDHAMYDPEFPVDSRLRTDFDIQAYAVWKLVQMLSKTTYSMAYVEFQSCVINGDDDRAWTQIQGWRVDRCAPPPTDDRQKEFRRFEYRELDSLKICNGKVVA